MGIPKWRMHANRSSRRVWCNPARSVSILRYSQIIGKPSPSQQFRL